MSMKQEKRYFRILKTRIDVVGCPVGLWALSLKGNPTVSSTSPSHHWASLLILHSLSKYFNFSVVFLSNP